MNAPRNQDDWWHGLMWQALDPPREKRHAPGAPEAWAPVDRAEMPALWRQQ